MYKVLSHQGRESYWVDQEVSPGSLRRRVREVMLPLRLMWCGKRLFLPLHKTLLVLLIQSLKDATRIEKQNQLICRILGLRDQSWKLCNDGTCLPFSFLFFFFPLLTDFILIFLSFMDVELIYKVVINSAVQQSDSVLHTSIRFQVPLPLQMT